MALMLRAARRMASSFRLSPFCILFLLLAAGSLFGKKSASFSARRDYLAADDASTPAVADLKGDAILDVVLPDKTNNPAFTTDVSALIGKPDGTFGPPRFF